MDNILLMLAHPRFEKSRANKALLTAVQDLPFVTVHDLYELYPDFNIDIAREHELLTQHQIIIWQYPLYMYSPPAILKQWMDLVLEHGWAHGPGGNNLVNKLLFNTITTGGSTESYGPKGFNNYRLDEFLRPLEQTARLCKMIWLPIFSIQGTYRHAPEHFFHYGNQYRRALQRLAEGNVNLTNICKHPSLNEWIASPEERETP
jgi:glutathione-regulated potassium-efflux system ancillary protein KefG